MDNENSTDPKTNKSFLSSELDALGDELLMDDDSSYLDEAATAPSIPEGNPGDRTANRVQKKNVLGVITVFYPQAFIAKSFISGWCPGG